MGSQSYQHCSSLTLMSLQQCPEGIGCDLCPGTTIANDSLAVTINVPGTGNSQTLSCGEWFIIGCTTVQLESCAAYQVLLAECCTAVSPPTAAPVAPVPPVGVSRAGSNVIAEPTIVPSEVPSIVSSEVPSIEPSEAPSNEPSEVPSGEPSDGQNASSNNILLRPPFGEAP